MKIHHIEISNWILAICAVIGVVLAFIPFFKEEKPVSIQSIDGNKNQQIGDILNNSGSIVVNSRNDKKLQLAKTDKKQIIIDKVPPKRVTVSKENTSSILCNTSESCPSEVNKPKVYGDAPKKNVCWELSGIEDKILDQHFGAVIKFGEANIVQRCGQKVFTLYRWSPNENLLSTEILNEFYAHDGFKFTKFSDRVWKYEKKWRTK